jgi:phosphoribosyl-AMP cyclohydrolase
MMQQFFRGANEGKRAKTPKDKEADMSTSVSAPRPAKHELEEGLTFAPKFDADGLIVCITTEVHTGDILMVAYMNEEALRLTLETSIAHYWSRSRKSLWRKGDTSGQVQTVVEMRTDCDQDAILLKVEAGGDGKACHTGRRSCFYRRVVHADGRIALEFTSD